MLGYMVKSIRCIGNNQTITALDGIGVTHHA